jgi:hypothetical protein
VSSTAFETSNPTASGGFRKSVVRPENHAKSLLENGLAPAGRESEELTLTAASPIL